MVALDLAPERTAAGPAPARHFIVGNVRCAGCMAAVERTARAVPGVADARLHFSTRRLRVIPDRAGAPDDSRPDDSRPDDSRLTDTRVTEALNAAGYPATPFNPALLDHERSEDARALLRPLAVAGFAAANVMLLSVAVWAGLASDMGLATRALFHWVSAAVALPAIAYAGQPFFASALSALKARRLNMDVPISLAVILAAGLSLSQTIQGGAAVYFDAALTLLFFLLIGRALDLIMRNRARAAAHNLLGLQARTATLVDDHGHRRPVAIDALAPGARVAVAAGERIPVDGALAGGHAALDLSFLTGESAPVTVTAGEKVYAGAVNLNMPITVTVAATGEDTVLGEIVRLTEAAERARGHSVRLADQAARIYAPAVHIAGLAAFLGWWLIGGIGAGAALTIGIAVLIITCPCALGLAVPAVQAVASGRLMRAGLLLKDGAALERLAGVDHVVFDKTGTLTAGSPQLIDDGTWRRSDLQRAARLARASTHPLSRALAKAAGAGPAQDDVTEVPGAGLAGTIDGRAVRLGSAGWCRVSDPAGGAPEDENPGLWFRVGEAAPVLFRFADPLRDDAADAVARLRRLGVTMEIMSGDRPAAVAAAARALGGIPWQAAQTPQQKIARLDALKAAGRTPLMVGDGLNDAPALAAASVSLSPAGASDIAKTAADLVLQGQTLGPVPEALVIARRARRLILQNFGLALVYNLIAVPLAVAGLVTPLIAAVAMSASSILVTANSLRLAGKRLWIS